jgi:hypothetical protein
MSYHLYYQRLKEILKKSMTIDNLLDRLKYLRRERAWFISQNDNSDVPRIVVLYDLAIQETEDLIKLDFQKPVPKPEVQFNQVESLSAEQMIKTILEPVREAFDSPDHIDRISEALIEYSKNSNLPEKTDKERLKTPVEYYYYFKQVRPLLGMSYTQIANVLVYFIRHYDDVAASTISSQIKKSKIHSKDS